ncbi:MAG: hypothetical protein QG574_343 [Cyanobacteriota bacterium erpe_2018_sw_21hr_WHONDRS-SW48-000092_B_bin.40]|jgi:tetratricopeptide (TPR) repeat protein|nr:hypothetical protein [Cyanobacteriota bacterium erpe_2018_sw_21hr_WHONDRS-SW48-000092_B_bin.40]
MFLKRFSSLTMVAAIVVAVTGSIGPAQCGDAAKQEKNLVLLKQIEEDLVKTPGDVDLQVRHMQALGVAHRRQDQLREAEILISKHPRLREAFKGKMFALIGLRNWTGAMTAMEQVKKLGPLSSAELTIRGSILAGLERYQEALIDLNESIFRDSSDAGAYFTRAECLYKLHGPTADVVYNLEKTLKLEPDFPNARKLLESMDGNLTRGSQPRVK